MKALPARLAELLISLASLLLIAAPALAHPHIWADSRSTIVFDDTGVLSAIRQHWVFDKAFSAWAVQGLDTDGDGKVSSAEMAELTAEYINGLAQYDYYTLAGFQNDENGVALRPAPGARMAYDNGNVTLDFTLVPDTPVRLDRPFEIETNDPEYYVAFTYEKTDGASLENAPPGCTVTWHGPGELPPDVAERLSAIPADRIEIPPDLKAAVRAVANVAIIDCQGAGAQMASQQEDMPSAGPASVPEAQADTGPIRPKSAPFAAPPPELGVPMPRTGFLGWINSQQQRFYGELTTAMAGLRTNNHAFFVLGVLSFLYGVFHAAGPGHGKVVISTYAMAGERDLRRGIALSFAAALVQSITAIIVVGIMAVLLGATSMAMSDMTGAMALLSYGLLAALGAWLIARKVFGLGHHHGHAHHAEDDLDIEPGPTAQPHRHAHAHDGHHHHRHEHDHSHEDGHDHHMIAPSQTHGSLREMAAVVLTVGLRPCSGALVVLVFALSQGVLAAGVIAVLLMGLGTALSIALLASLSVLMKSAALRYAGPGKGLLSGAVWWAELAGALAILAFGIILLLASF